MISKQTALSKFKHWANSDFNLRYFFKKISKWLFQNQRFLIPVCLILLILTMAPMFFSDKMGPTEILINFILILPLFGIILLITHRTHIAYIATALILFVLFCIDEIVYSSRLVHLRYGDIFAIGDGLRVAGKYNFALTFKGVLVLLSIIAISIAIIFISKKVHEKQNKKENAIIGGTILIMSLSFIIFGSILDWIPDPMNSIDDNFDSNGVVDKAGLIYAIYGQYMNSSLEKPDGYSHDLAEQILSTYQTNTSENIDEPVDVIVIMNEGLADYSLVGKPSFTDPLLNIHNPDNGYFEGKLAVSVFGGYTCNTEFEFLTGASMRFLPTETIPFSQLINSTMSSLAWDAKTLGMNTCGVHPYYSQEWNRRNVYANLGFDSFIAGEDFSSGLAGKIKNITDTKLKELDFGDDLEYIRGFISDKECYSKVLDVLNSSIASSNFIFAVTVQNHGGFDYVGSDFQNFNYIDGEDLLNQYLTLSSISDNAYHDFIIQLKERDKKTIVLMFGDHQPGLDFSNFVDGYKKDAQNRYYVPYVVWSNFNLPIELPTTTSANYLSALLKQAANLPLDEWDKFRLDTESKYPIITGNFIVDDEGNYYGRSSSSAQLQEYEIVQYDKITTKLP